MNAIADTEARTLPLEDPLADAVLVVIVNYRTVDLTLDCLRSLREERDRLRHMQVVVTDNASGDGSVPRLRQFIDEDDWASWIQLMPLPKNGGFAYGNNAAVRPELQAESPPRYVLLLNPDTVVRPDAVAALVRFMNDHPRIGIAGSRLEDPDGTPQRSAFRFPTVAGEFEGAVRFGPVTRLLRRFVIAPPVSDRAEATPWVAGASMIVRREVFEEVGLLDEGYFMYYEEVDFCWRAAGAGWPCWYVPESRVIHLVGQASGVTNLKAIPKRRPAYWFESRRRFFLRNRGYLYTLACDAVFILAFSIWRIRRRLQRKPDTDPPHMLRDFLRHSAFVKGGCR